MASFNDQNRDGAKLYQAQKAAEAEKRPKTSWWLNLPRTEFQAEVQRRHQCILNSRNPSVRSLGKVI